MESNDLYMVAGAGALVAAADLWGGLTLALVVLSVALIYFAHTATPVVLRLPKRAKPVTPEQPQPVYNDLERTAPVVMAHCEVCKKAVPQGQKHECTR